MPHNKKPITELVAQRTLMLNHLDQNTLSGLAEERLLNELEHLNWQIANTLASDIPEVFSKTKLLREVSASNSPHTIEGALLRSIIDDLSKLSN